MSLRLVFVAFLACSILISPVVLEAESGPVYKMPPELGKSERFVFAVIGDSRDSVPIDMPEVFREIIAELNILAPEFVFDVGDLIMGYTEDEDLIREEWRVFLETVAAFEMPFVPVVGNHDVWDEMSEKIYRELVCDDLYFAFRHKGARFIVLDSDKAGEAGKIGETQLAWLRNELESNAEEANHTFIFMHKPLWGYNPKYTNWHRDVHPLLVEHGVSHVFCGHWHCYNYKSVDGVNYIVTGGGGAELDGDREHGGGFHHYLLVTVGEEEVSWAVQEPGGVLPFDSILYDISTRFYRLGRGVHGFPFIEFPLSKRMKASLPVYNPFKDSLSLSVTVQQKPEEQTGDVWSVSVTPGSFELVPEARGEVEIDIVYKGKKKGEPTVRPPALTLVHDFSSLDRTVTIERDLIVTQVLPLKKVKKIPEIDGDLSEWRKAPATMRFDGSRVASGGEGSAESRAADVKLGWAETGLYLAATIEDDIHEPGTRSLNRDVLTLYLSLGADPRIPGEDKEIFIGWRFLETDEGSESIPVPWLEDNMKNAGDVRCAVIHEDGLTRYEAEIPVSTLMLEEDKLSKGFTCFGDVQIVDMDGENEPVISAWTEALTTKGNTAAYFVKLKME